MKNLFYRFLFASTMIFVSLCLCIKNAFKKPFKIKPSLNT